MKQTLIMLAGILLTGVSQAENAAVDQLIDKYQSEAATTGNPEANPEAGQKIWSAKHSGKEPFTERSCQSCHGNDLTQPGKHVRTNKPIKPIAPSTNPQSLRDVSKIEKWLKRNCTWTIGRECSTQEKAHLLSYLKHQ